MRWHGAAVLHRPGGDHRCGAGILQPAGHLPARHGGGDRLRAGLFAGNIAGLVSNSLMGLALDLTGKSGGALWAFAGCLLLSSLLVVALPAKVVNR